MTRWARGSTWPRTPLCEAGSSGGRPSDPPGPYRIGLVSWREGDRPDRASRGRAEGLASTGIAKEKLMRTATTTTFEVSEVRRATAPLPEVPYKQAVEALLTVAMPERDREWVESLAKRGVSLDLPGPPASRPIEACTRYHGRLLADVSSHPVVAAVHAAFVDHRPLRLSPDAIWLMICQAVANHVNAHAERMRPRFVRHRGTVEIVVRRDDFVKGSPGNPWAEVLDEFSERVREHVGPAIDLFVPAFSTTGPVERAAAGVVLLDAVGSYFRYSTGSLCGIPEVALDGTT